MKSFRTGAALATYLLVTGCAFTIHDSPLNYSYGGIIDSSAGASALHGVQVGAVVDERTVDRPEIISHLVNGYGQTTTGGYVAEQPIADIVKSGVEEALSQAGYSDRDNRFTMNLTIEDYEYEAVAGFWSAKSITSELTMGIRMESNGRAIAQNTVIGRVQLEPEEFRGKQDRELVVSLFNRALDDAIDQILAIVEIEANRNQQRIAGLLSE